jgi:hypothetical protein
MKESAGQRLYDMSHTQNFLITLSLICWFGIIVFEIIQKQYKRKELRFLIHLILMVVSGFIMHYYFGYFNTTQEKGSLIIAEHWTLLGLYLFTITGIVGHHIFIQIRGIEEQKRRSKIKWMPLIKPLIISPIIFLTVMNQLTQMGAEGEGLKANIMQYIFAFQNGFFWKTIFEQLERKKD